MKENEPVLVDLKKLKSKKGSSEMPFIKISYEPKTDEIVEATLTEDEIYEWFDEI